MDNKVYIPSLDGLRAMAVALVILTHLSHSRFPGGDIGVDVFFTLSGFLITGILLRERVTRGRIRIGAFYLRRVLRLMPAMTLMVVATLCCESIMGGPDQHKIGSAVAAMLYAMDIVRAYSGYSEVSPLGHTWSLAVEEHFYLIWPLLIGPLCRLKASARAPSCLILICILVCWRAWGAKNGYSHDRIYYAFDMRADQLLVGCALAAWLAAKPSRHLLKAYESVSILAPFVFLVIALSGTGENWFARAFVPLITSLTSSVMIIGLIGKPRSIISRLFSTTPVTAIGRVSYGIYLWHWPLLLEARFIWPDNKRLALIAIIVSVAIAFVSYYAVERPFLRLKRHFESGTEGPSVDAQAVSQVT